MIKKKLNDREWKVLKFLTNDEAYEEGMAYYFRTIARRTRLTIPVVRRACRSLKRKGLSEYNNALFTDDGDLAGSGYSATSLGIDYMVQELSRIKIEKEFLKAQKKLPLPK